MRQAPSPNLPQTLPLWPEGLTPLATAEDGALPQFTYYLPSEEFRTGQSVLICPGGGYNMVSSPKEGHRPAQFLVAHGVAAAVLEYRHAPSRHPVPLLDVQRGIRLLRQLAKTNGLRPDRVGVMGFSAGGHLAGTTATQPSHPTGEIGDLLSSIPCHPDLLILVYPVVSLISEHAHTGSRDSLLGEDPPPAMARALSLECAVSATTPPTFLAHGQADRCVPPQNSLDLYAALTSHGVPATLHLYEGDDHGFGLGANHPWGSDLLAWLTLHR